MPLVWFVLPGFGTLLSSGWAIDAIRRRARREPLLIPQLGDIASFFKHGIVVVVMALLYFGIPVGIFVWLTEVSFLGQVAQLWALIVDVWHGRPHQTFGAFLLQRAIALITHSAVPGIYVVLAIPMFFVARLRYAISNRLSSFFDLIGNATVCLQHIGQILLYLFFATLIRGTLSFIGGTLIGTVIPIFLGGASVWILAYVAGQLAAEIKTSRPPKNG